MTDAPYIDVLETVFPVLAVRPDAEGQVARPDFFGTAFAVGPGVFMTAARVVVAAREYGALAIGKTGGDGQPIRSVTVEHVEAWPDRDIARLFCNNKVPTVLDTWMVKPVQFASSARRAGRVSAGLSAP